MIEIYTPELRVGDIIISAILGHQDPRDGFLVYWWLPALITKLEEPCHQRKVQFLSLSGSRDMVILYPHEMCRVIRR